MIQKRINIKIKQKFVYQSLNSRLGCEHLNPHKICVICHTFINLPSPITHLAFTKPFITIISDNYLIFSFFLQLGPDFNINLFIYNYGSHCYGRYQLYDNH